MRTFPVCVKAEEACDTAPEGAWSTDPWPAEGHCAVPYWAYTDPRVYQREQQRVFARSWNYVGLLADIPHPGSHRRTFAGDLAVVITRTADGGVSCLVNQCSHRGVELVHGACGTVRKHFTCPYHQWSFDHQGQLVGIPYRRGAKGKGGMPEDFDPCRHNIRSLKVAVRHGAIFASLDPEEPDFEKWLGPKMLPYFDRTLDGRELRVLGRHRQRIGGNWKQYVENLRDPYHGTILHVWFVTFGLARADHPGAVVLDDHGRHCVLVHHRSAPGADLRTEAVTSFRESMKLHDTRLLELRPEREGTISTTMQSLWPNLVIATQQNSLAMRHVVPRGPREFDLNWTFFGYAGDSEEMTRHRIRQANLSGPAGYISADDGEVLLNAGRGVAAHPSGRSVVEMGGRDTADADHVVTEVGVRAFYRRYRHVMGF